MTVLNNDVMGICLHFFPFAGAWGDAGIWEFICIMKNLKAVQMAGITVTLKQEHRVF